MDAEMSWITNAWQFVADEVRDLSDAMHGRNGLTGAEAWHDERAAETERHAAPREAVDQTGLARDADGRSVEVDADGYPAREVSPDDSRLVAQAQDQADADYRRWAQEQDSGQRGGNPPASRALDREIDRAAEEWPEYVGPDHAQEEVKAGVAENYKVAIYPRHEGPGYTESPVNWEAWHQDHTGYEKDHYWGGHCGGPLPEDPDPPALPEMDAEPDPQSESEPERRAEPEAEQL